MLRFLLAKRSALGILQLPITAGHILKELRVDEDVRQATAEQREYVPVLAQGFGWLILVEAAAAALPVSEQAEESAVNGGLVCQNLRIRFFHSAVGPGVGLIKRFGLHCGGAGQNLADLGLQVLQ